jgi:hypothetical protein
MTTGLPGCRVCFDLSGNSGTFPRDAIQREERALAQLSHTDRPERVARYECWKDDHLATYRGNDQALNDLAEALLVFEAGEQGGTLNAGIQALEVGRRVCHRFRGRPSAGQQAYVRAWRLPASEPGRTLLRALCDKEWPRGNPTAS